MIFYSQNFEDVLLWRALGNIKNGKYIDIGAHHPIIDSVSRVFYEQGWRGIHIEPPPSYAEMLRNDRPGEHVIEAAVSARPGILRFFDIQGSGLSTADPEIAEHHRAQGWNVCEITVPTVALDNIFGLIDDGIVHWLKIDVEGHERQVLEGWSAAVLPWVVVVESTYPCTQIDTYQAWEELLLAKGYLFAHHDGLNRYYISPEHPEIVPAFRYGANVFDGFQLADHHWAVTAQRQQLEAQRAQAQAREDELRQQAGQLFQAQQAAAAQQAEHLQAQIATLQDGINEQASYAQALVERIVAMQSTWWWRFSMLWRQPSKWLPLPTPLLTQRQRLGAQSGALFAADKSGTFANTTSGEPHKAPPPRVGEVGRGMQETDSQPLFPSPTLPANGECAFFEAPCGGTSAAPPLRSTKNNLTRSFPMHSPS